MADLLAPQQPHQDVERLVHAVALLGDGDAHHEGVGRERAGARAEHHPASGHVVELVDAVGQHHRMVVGKRRNAGAQTDVLGAFGRCGDEDLRRGD